MSIKIIEASINSSLQDFGRKKFAKFGIARSGAMDGDALNGKYFAWKQTR